MRLRLFRWAMALLACATVFLGGAQATCHDKCMHAFNGGVWEPLTTYYCKPLDLLPVEGDCHPAWTGCFECYSLIYWNEDYHCLWLGDEIEEGEGWKCSAPHQMNGWTRTPTQCNYGTQTCNLGAPVPTVHNVTNCEVCTAG